MVIVEFFAINTVTNDGNVGIRYFKLAKKKVTSMGLNLMITGTRV